MLKLTKNDKCDTILILKNHQGTSSTAISWKSEHSRAKMIGRVFQDPMKGTAPN